MHIPEMGMVVAFAANSRCAVGSILIPSTNRAGINVTSEPVSNRQRQAFPPTVISMYTSRTVESIWSDVATATILGGLGDWGRETGELWDTCEGASAPC